MTGDIRDPVVFALNGMEEAMQAVLASSMPSEAISRQRERLDCQKNLMAIKRVRRLWAEMANSSTAQIIAETMESGPA